MLSYTDGNTLLRAKTLWRARLRRETADQDAERRGENPTYRPDNGVWLTELIAKNRRAATASDPPLLGKGHVPPMQRGKGKGTSKSRSTSETGKGKTWLPVGDGNSDTAEQRKLKDEVLIKMPKDKISADIQRQRSRDQWNQAEAEARQDILLEKGTQRGKAEASGEPKETKQEGDSEGNDPTKPKSPREIIGANHVR